MEVENNLAYIISEISKKREQAPGKKVLQKMVFLIEEKGIQLGYKYGLHFYGPYSSSLSDATDFLNIDGVLIYEQSNLSHLVKIRDNVEVTSTFNQDQISKVDDVIERYKVKKPTYLELLTTALYAYDNLEDKSKESVIRGVQKIKGEKYTIKEIEDALNEFEYFDKSLV